MNQIIDSLLQILEYTLLAYFGFASIYIFIFSFAGLWYRPRTQKTRGKIRKIAILIPGYKEDQVIIEVTKSALLQRYPMNQFDVVVIAERPKISPYAQGIRDNLAAALGLPGDAVNVKATTSEGLGFTGRGEGMAAQAVCTLRPEKP